MSDETPTPDAEPATETTAESPDTGGAVATIIDAPLAHPTPPAERVTFRSKFLMPLLVPLGVAATIIFYILNVSRVFLAVGGSIAVTYAAVITVIILAGGSALAASPKVRSSSLTLIVGGSLLVLLMGGLISIGAASPKTASGPVECTGITSKLSIVAGANSALRFTPSDLNAKAGCIQIKVTFDGTHTLQFDDPAAANAFPLLDVNKTTWAGKLPAGTYKFHCTIPGHETAGMVGVLTVT
jgi:plastocyanin